MLNCRSLTKPIWTLGWWTNPAAIWGFLGMLCLQILFAHAPVMNRFFHTAPLGWPAWPAALAYGLIVFAIVEIEKYLVGHKLQGENFRLAPARSRRGRSQKGSDSATQVHHQA